MNLTSKEADIVFRIMAELSGAHNSADLRTRVGKLLLDLLDADHFASYVWNEKTGAFDGRVAINMADDNLDSYEQHFQFCDPITPVLQRRRRATPVSHIMAQKRLERTEFFNDFLARDGLRYGINFHAHAGGRNIGDLRIWRSRHKENFAQRDVDMLDAIGVAFTNSMQQCRMPRHDVGCGAASEDREGVGISAADGLTAREQEIAAAIALGKPDKRIAEDLGIGFSTVRTHIKHIFRKFDVQSRTQLIGRIRRH